MMIGFPLEKRLKPGIGTSEIREAPLFTAGLFCWKIALAVRPVLPNFWGPRENDSRRGRPTD